TFALPIQYANHFLLYSQANFYSLSFLQPFADFMAASHSTSISTSNSDSGGDSLVIDVYSDLACPWCYVGLRASQLARESFAKQRSSTSLPISLRLHPFIIDPATKSTGED